jgi:hypothetical protein
MQPFSTLTGTVKPPDTRGLTQEHVGKHLRVELNGGERMEVLLHELTVCDRPEPCCGITYVLISTNRRDGEKEIGNAYWTGFGEIKDFAELGD